MVPEVILGAGVKLDKMPVRGGLEARWDGAPWGLFAGRSGVAGNYVPPGRQEVVCFLVAGTGFEGACWP
jgi:hypothetical protein